MMRIIPDTVKSASTDAGFTVTLMTIGLMRMRHRRGDLAPDQAATLVERIKKSGRIDVNQWVAVSRSSG